MTKYLHMEAMDSLFFRDSRPFNAGDAGQMEVASVFPPNADTVVGALRAALAHQQGWQHGKWSNAICATLGNGEALAPLRFTGPFLLEKQQCLFPLPAHILAKTVEDTLISTAYLQPSGEKLLTDIGERHLVALPQGSGAGFKNISNAYVSTETMRKILAGEALEVQEIKQDLWQSETRVGIERNHLTSIINDGQFYQSSHTRLKKNISLGMTLTGYEQPIPKLATLGGESRMVYLNEVAAWALPEMPNFDVVDDHIYYTLITITPTKLNNYNWANAKTLADVLGKDSDVDDEIISACIGKVLRIGGWDSVARQPKALQPYLPAGSVFFMKTHQDNLERIKKYHGQHIGERTAWGYGHVLVGKFTGGKL